MAALIHARASVDPSVRLWVRACRISLVLHHNSCAQDRGRREGPGGRDQAKENGGTHLRGRSGRGVQNGAGARAAWRAAAAWDLNVSCARVRAAARPISNWVVPDGHASRSFAATRAARRRPFEVVYRALLRAFNYPSLGSFDPLMTSSVFLPSFLVPLPR